MQRLKEQVKRIRKKQKKFENGMGAEGDVRENMCLYIMQYLNNEY
jgi:hypothetical protein